MKLNLFLSQLLKLSALASMFMVSGCTPFDPAAYLGTKHSSILMQGNSVSYANGYTDGCASGRNEAGDLRFQFQKNNAIASKDKDYASGWADGHTSCRKEYQNWLKNQRNEEEASYYREKRRALEAERWEKWSKK